jgi:hypothetical protein
MACERGQREMGYAPPDAAFLSRHLYPIHRWLELCRVTNGFVPSRCYPEEASCSAYLVTSTALSYMTRLGPGRD